MDKTEGQYVLAGDLSRMGRQRLEGNFRMSREAFEYLWEELSLLISKRDTNLPKGNFRSPATSYYTLYRLAEIATYRTVANLFGIGKSTVCEIVLEVCEAILEVLLPRYIRLPQNAQEIRQRIDNFRDRAGFPKLLVVLMVVIFQLSSAKQPGRLR